MSENPAPRTSPSNHPGVGAIHLLNDRSAALARATEAQANRRTKMVKCLRSIMRRYLAALAEIPNEYDTYYYTSKESVGIFSGDSETFLFVDFEQWVVAVCIHFCVDRFGGPKCDAERTLTLPTFLGRKAEQWYYNHVVGLQSTQSTWKFENIIVGLYDRFIHISNGIDALIAFHNVYYVSSLSIKGLFDTLVEYEERMISPLDNSSVNHIFLARAPYEIRKRLLEYIGLHPVYNTPGNFVEEALRIKEGKRMYAESQRYYNSVAWPGPKRGQPKTSKAQPTRAQIDYPSGSSSSDRSPKAASRMAPVPRSSSSTSTKSSKSDYALFRTEDSSDEYF